MIRPFPGVVVGEVFLHRPGSKGHGSEDRSVAWGMVRDPEDDIREQHGIGPQDIQVDMLEVVLPRGVVRVALHQDEVAIDIEDSVNGPLDIADIRSAG